MSNFIQKAMLAAAMGLGLSAIGVSGAAAQVETLQTCGANVESNVATSNNSRTVTSATFTNVFSGRFLLTPGVVADCAVLTFNAEAACKGASALDVCYVRALVNGVPMLPTSSTRIFTSESGTPAAHSYSWVKRGLLTGNQNFTVQVRVGAAGTSFVIDDWTLFIQYFS